MARVIGSFDLDFSPDAQSSGRVIATTTNRVTVEFSPGYTGRFLGTFQLDGAGNVSGGTVTGYEEYGGDVRVVAITELNLPATAIVPLQAVGDGIGVLNQLFGGSDSITGSPFADFVIALNGNDTMDGGGGDDDVNGNVGADLVRGGEGADIVRGGRDNDTVFGDGGADAHVNGNLGDDQVSGGIGNDTVFGGQGNDNVNGDSSDDYVFGDLGNDTVTGGTGEDILTGGAGADRFVFRTGSEVDAIIDFNSAEGDRIVLSPGTTYTVTTFEGHAVIDIHNPTDAIILYGVTVAQMGDWLVFG